MSHRHKNRSHHGKPSGSGEFNAFHKNTVKEYSAACIKPKLEFVLKCDSAGSVEAVAASILKMVPPDACVTIIHSGIGDINKSDILLAETGSRLIAGFQVGGQPGIERELKEHAVEARLYDVIYRLTDDINTIAASIVPHEPVEEILGTARVIALFKSCRKGIIMGCEVMTGHLAVNNAFRIISAVGPVYAGAIGSIHIENNAVNKVYPGQKAGIKIKDFNKVHIGDIVESYRPPSPRKARVWQPTGHMIRIT